MGRPQVSHRTRVVRVSGGETSSDATDPIVAAVLWTQSCCHRDSRVSLSDIAVALSQHNSVFPSPSRGFRRAEMCASADVRVSGNI